MTDTGGMLGAFAYRLTFTPDLVVLFWWLVVVLVAFFCIVVPPSDIWPDDTW